MFVGYQLVVTTAFIFFKNCRGDEWELPPSFRIDFESQGHCLVEKFAPDVSHCTAAGIISGKVDVDEVFASTSHKQLRTSGANFSTRQWPRKIPKKQIRLGYQTASALASRGANVIIADVANTDEAVNNIKQETGNSKVKEKFLDLSSLESVRRFCDEIHKEESRLDILINNAGVIGLPLSYTADGLQAHMQTNYFGHFLLTHLLLDLLKESQGRIIFVSSIAVFASKLTLDNLNKPILFRKKLRTHWTIYCNSKLCELIASNIFAEKLKMFGITSNAVHPGFVMTAITSSVVNSNYDKWANMFGNVVLKICGKTAYEGAQVQINCALSKDLEHVSGKFFVDCIPFYQPSVTRNREFCMKIWEKSEELVRLRPEEKI